MEFLLFLGRIERVAPKERQLLRPFFFFISFCFFFSAWPCAITISAASSALAKELLKG
jgi:hypothetical protein